MSIYEKSADGHKGGGEGLGLYNVDTGAFEAAQVFSSDSSTASPAPSLMATKSSNQYRPSSFGKFKSAVVESRVTILKIAGILVFIWAFAGIMSFKESPYPQAPSLPSSSGVEASSQEAATTSPPSSFQPDMNKPSEELLRLDSTIDIDENDEADNPDPGPGSSDYNSKPGYGTAACPTVTKQEEAPHATSTTKYTDRAAVIVETRPLPNLVSLILHYHAVLGPEWPVVLYTTSSTARELLNSSAALARAVNPSGSRSIEVRELPSDKHQSASLFLTDSWLWENLAPWNKILLFRSDAILCANSPLRADDFVSYDLIGASTSDRGLSPPPLDMGPLSVRNRELVLRVLSRWTYDAAEGEEDQWLYARARELEAEGRSRRGTYDDDLRLPDEAVARRFAVGGGWEENEKRPLGIYVLSASRWQQENNENKLEGILRYCPEVGMISSRAAAGG